MRADDSLLQACSIAPDVATAQLQRGLLEAAGIPAQVAEEHLAGMAWHLSTAIGGVRVLVPADQLEAARAVLGLPDKAGNGEQRDPSEAEEEDPDKPTYRALRVAMVSLFLIFFGVVQLYALVLVARAARSWSDLSPRGKRRLLAAGLIAAAATALWVAAVWALATT